jgi:hypothetical protein
MTRGFYDQIGVPFDADLDQIRAAYGRSVAQLIRRREATVAQGGDTAALDLSRAQLDEAWEVLSDAGRRRRYDAMLAVAADGSPVTQPDALWDRVAGAMIHPSVAAGARLVDAVTRLKIGPLPDAPRAAGARGPTQTWDEEATLSARVQAVMRETFGPRRAVHKPEHGDGERDVPFIRETTPPVEDTASRIPARGGTDGGRPGAADAGRSGATDAGRPGATDAGRPGPAVAARPAARANVASVSAQAPPAGASPPAAPARATVQVQAPAVEHTPAPPVARPPTPPRPPEPPRVTVVAPAPAAIARPAIAPGPSGAMLRAAREAKGLTIAAVSESTRISARYLEALEAEDFTVLPSATAFVRGYVREVARLLDLDVERVVSGYMRRFSGDA